MVNFPYLFIVAPIVLAILVAVLLMTRRRITKDIVCPRDRLPRKAVFVGHTVDPDAWEEVVSCERPGEAPLVGRQLTCDKACLGEAENAPRHDLGPMPLK